MDHIDRCIVDILQHNARLPVKEIASRVSLSSPAVCARIERLEKSGVLAGYQAIINVTAIGYLVKAFISLFPYHAGAILINKKLASRINLIIRLANILPIII